MVMSPEELSFLHATKRGGPSKEWKGAAISQPWQASGDSYHQDVWQTPDEPHQLMRGHVQFVGVISVHPEHMGME